MYLHDISHGTTFNVIFDDGRKITGEFAGRIDHINFYFNLSNDFEQVDASIGELVKIECKLKEDYCSFTAEILAKNIRNPGAKHIFSMVIKSPIKIVPRRESHRIDLKMTVKVHSFTSDRKLLFTQDILCESVTEDISKGGARIWTDYDLSSFSEGLFILEFSQPLRGSYYIPSKLVRSNPNSATLVYDYDLGFAFDFSDGNESQDRFIVDVVETKLKSNKQ